MFFFLPVGMNYRTERLPLVTFILIGINVLVYLVTLGFSFKTGGDSDLWILQHLWLIPDESHCWMYLTSMFVHAGFFHLLGNMIFLFLFGSCVEDLIGRVRYIIFYLLGGLAAELVYIAMQPEHFASVIPMGGASGAISACLGMYLLLRAGAVIEFRYFIWFIVIKAGEFELPAWVAITFWFLKDLLSAVLGMMSKHGGGGVAFGAHVGGLLGGLAMVGTWQWLNHRRETGESEPVPADRIIDPNKITATPFRKPPVKTSETPTIFLHEAGAQSGPFTLTEIQTRLTLKEISTEAQYWSEGMTSWESVSDLAGSPL